MNHKELLKACEQRGQILTVLVFEKSLDKKQGLLDYSDLARNNNLDKIYEIDCNNFIENNIQNRTLCW